MSQYYVIRSNSYSNELYHYGVKGMKWGVRKAVSNVKKSYVKKRNQRADSTIRLAEYRKKRDELYYDYAKNDLKIKRMQSSKRFSRIKDAIYDYRLDQLETNANKDLVRNNWDIAKANGKKNKAYTQTEDYRKKRREYNMVLARDMVDAMLYS